MSTRTERESTTEAEFSAEECLAGGGELGALMRSLDWSRTPVGPVETWPQSLRTAVSICLGSRHPLEIWWGPQYVRFYNDAYRPILGANKHPQFLGRPGRECWGEIWDQIGPMLDSVRQTGEATWSEDYQLILERNGYPEETYFTFSYGPLRVESGAVGGIFCACTETTSRVFGERRLRTLRELAARSAEAREVEEACRLLAGALATNPLDVPFALIYLIDGEHAEARLIASTGLEPGSAAAPETISISGAEDERGWRIGRMVADGASRRVDDVDARFGAIVGETWPEPIRTAMLLPIALRGRQQQTVAMLIVGTSPRLPIDQDYAQFLESIRAQCSTAVADAESFAEERRRAVADAERDRMARTRLTNIFMQAPAFIAVLSGPEHVFELANQPYYQIIGQREIVGRPVREALPEVVEQGFVEILNEVYTTGRPFVGTDVRVMLQTGGSGPLVDRYLDFTYQPLHGADGAVNGIFVHGIDLTDRRHAERERERLLELEQSAREELERQRDQLSRANEEILAASRVLQAQQEHQAVVVRYLRGTNRAAAGLTTAESSAAIIDTLIGTLVNDFRASICAVWLTSANGRKLILAGEKGMEAAPTPSLEREIEILLHPYKVGWVARYRRPFVSNDVADDVHFDRSWLAANRIASAAVQPLIFQDQLLGVMAVFFNHELPIEASEVLATLASVVSTGLDGVREKEEAPES